MNALTLLITTLLVYALAYRRYTGFIIAKVLAFDNGRPTPAHTLKNDCDYKLTNV